MRRRSVFKPVHSSVVIKFIKSRRGNRMLEVKELDGLVYKYCKTEERPNSEGDIEIFFRCKLRQEFGNSCDKCYKIIKRNGTESIVVNRGKGHTCKRNVLPQIITLEQFFSGIFELEGLFISSVQPTILHNEQRIATTTLHHPFKDFGVGGVSILLVDQSNNRYSPVVLGLYPRPGLSFVTFMIGDDSRLMGFVDVHIRVFCENQTNYRCSRRSSFRFINPPQVAIMQVPRPPEYNPRSEIQLILPNRGPTGGGTHCEIFFSISRDQYFNRLQLANCNFSCKFGNNPGRIRAKMETIQDWARSSKRKMVVGSEFVVLVTTPHSTNNMQGPVNVEINFGPFVGIKPNGFFYINEKTQEEIEEEMMNIPDEEEEVDNEGISFEENDFFDDGDGNDFEGDQETLDDFFQLTEDPHDMNPDQVDFAGADALFYAVGKGDLELVKFYIEKKFFSMYHQDILGYTCMDVASHFGHEKILEYFKEKKECAMKNFEKTEDLKINKKEEEILAIKRYFNKFHISGRKEESEGEVEEEEEEKTALLKSYYLPCLGSFMEFESAIVKFCIKKFNNERIDMNKEYLFSLKLDDGCLFLLFRCEEKEDIMISYSDFNFSRAKFLNSTLEMFLPSNNKELDLKFRFMNRSQYEYSYKQIIFVGENILIEPIDFFQPAAGYLDIITNFFYQKTKSQHIIPTDELNFECFSKKVQKSIIEKDLAKEIIEGSEYRGMWSKKYLQLELLSMFISRKGFESHLDGLSKEFRILFLRLEELKTVEDFRRCLNKFNQSRFVELQKVHFETMVLCSEVGLGDMLVEGHLKMIKDQKSFEMDPERLEFVFHHLKQTLQDLNENGIFQLCVKKVISVHKKRGEFQNEIFDSIFLPNDVLEEGNIHYSLYISNIRLDWMECGFVRVCGNWIGNNKFHELCALGQYCPVVFGINKFIDLIGVVAHSIILYNINGVYININSQKKKKKKKTSLDFVDDLLELLKISPDPIFERYLNIMSKEIMNPRIVEFKDYNKISKLEFSIIKDLDYVEDGWERVADKFPELKDGEDINLDTHGKVIEVYEVIKRNIDKFKNRYNGIYEILKGNCRAFHLRDPKKNKPNHECFLNDREKIWMDARSGIQA